MKSTEVQTLGALWHMTRTRKHRIYHYIIDGLGLVFRGLLPAWTYAV